MQVRKSAFYVWKGRPPTLIRAVERDLYHRAKALFHANGLVLAVEGWLKTLREESFGMVVKNSSLDEKTEFGC